MRRGAAADRNAALEHDPGGQADADPDRLLAASAATPTALHGKVNTLAAAAGVNGAVVDLGSTSPLVTALNAQADDAKRRLPLRQEPRRRRDQADRRPVPRAQPEQPEVRRHRRRRQRRPVLPLPRHRRPRPRADLRPAGAVDLALARRACRRTTCCRRTRTAPRRCSTSRASTCPSPACRSAGWSRRRARSSRCSTPISARRGASSPTPHSSLVTGYDFLASGANAVEGDLERRARRGRDERHADHARRERRPRQSWTADPAEARQLLGSRHDLIFLGGHFSANNALAADYATTLNSTDLAASSVNLTNSIVFSAGCHSGYNIVNGDAVPNVTQPLDWAEAFAQKGATLIAGTGYQYGDTDFLAYSEQLYANFAHALRYGSGPVAVGDALVQAKQDYLSSDAEPAGDRREGAARVDALRPADAERQPAGGPRPDAARAASPTSTRPCRRPTNPGRRSASAGSTTPPRRRSRANPVQLNGHEQQRRVTATYSERPGRRRDEPERPGAAAPAGQRRRSRFGTTAGKVLRGVGFRGGTFTDLAGITPLTGTPATELNGEPHAVRLEHLLSREDLVGQLLRRADGRPAPGRS